MIARIIFTKTRVFSGFSEIPAKNCKFAAAALLFRVIYRFLRPYEYTAPACRAQAIFFPAVRYAKTAAPGRMDPEPPFDLLRRIYNR